jgi:hypothetical protein
VKKVFFHIILITVGILLAFIVAELVTTSYFYLKDGEHITVADRLVREKNAFITDITDEECEYLDTFFPHPYLGFVHHANEPCAFLAEQTNNIGLFGYDYPFFKQDDYFVVFVTGGSVAAQFAQIFPNGPRYLEKILNQRYKSPKGKSFIILNGGEGGWKYPQQIILFLLYADVIDAVVTLDGYNELRNGIDSGYRLEYPATTFHRVNPLAYDSYEGLLSAWINRKIYQYSRSNWILSHSHLAYLITNRLRNMIAGYGNSDYQQDQTNTTIESIFSLPKEWDSEQRFKWNTEQYKKYIRIINYVAERIEIKTAHFIQPVPAIGKELTTEERKVVGDLSYGDKYLRMTNELLNLQNDGINIFSLLNIYEDVKEHVYGDVIHCIRKSRTYDSLGYLIMAKEIAKYLEHAWNLKSK